MLVYILVSKFRVNKPAMVGDNWNDESKTGQTDWSSFNI
jgi:hypothetical protein